MQAQETQESYLGTVQHIRFNSWTRFLAQILGVSDVVSLGNNSKFVNVVEARKHPSETLWGQQTGSVDNVTQV
jgi:acylphosphatase